MDALKNNFNDEKMSLQRQMEFQESSLLFDNVIYKSYLQSLSEAEVIPCDGNVNGIRWYRITKIVYEKDVFFTDKMSMLYASLHKVCGMVAMALHKEKQGVVEVYLGTRDVQGSDFISGDILEAGLKGILPGISIELSDKDMVDGFEKNKIAISCVSGVGSLSDDKKENFIQGIENLINATKSIPSFTTLIIADKISGEEASQIQIAYENLYSDISPLSQIQISFSESESKGVTETLTDGFNESISKNISHTISLGTSKSSSIGSSETTSKGWNTNGSLIFISGGGSGGRSVGESTQETVGSTENTADQTGEGTQKGEHHDKSHATNENTTLGKTMQLTKQNRHVKSCMDIIDRHINRIQKSVSSGLWSVATYFIAKDNTTSQKLASIYRGTIVGDKSEIETVSINHWPVKSPKIDSILSYLTTQRHPLFKLNEGIVTSAGSLVDSRELAIHLSLPQSSIPGLLVREEKAFGRDVKTYEDYSDDYSIEIGKILHLGEIYKENVKLGINGLSKHAFITGTTGSGKSNTLYLLLTELVKKGKKFLVIEPAKGEYKEVFGHNPEVPDVTVYGTNPHMSKLLTLNPFVFPDDIDVYEHIDSLVEIFNACWPMYAAMPQVLKHSIMDAYKSCGWDLSKSKNQKGIYPTIEDVLDSLKEYINSSEYSSDTKGDYKGSLETRLQSLCEGLLGRMFCGNPIPDEDLFNNNVIVDLSRVKSSETKSLLMGMLIMKLNEFRVSEHKGMNQDLRHATILEEAHNLLKRTSTDQTAESSNVAGMAVEKIANSMAEMRTYGEGFIIADQSPSMLDLSTIRNTNTKIIMALPEKEDRDVAGKAIGLRDEQIPEISRLKTGEAIVYQNGWEEPVKAKINIYKHSNSDPWDYHYSEEELGHKTEMNVIFETLYDLYAYSEISYHKEDFEKSIQDSALSGKKKYLLLDKVDSVEVPSVDDCAMMMTTIIGTDLCQRLQGIADIVSMNAFLYKELQQHEGLFNNENIDTFANMYMRGCSLAAKEPFYEEWQVITAKSKIL